MYIGDLITFYLKKDQGAEEAVKILKKEPSWAP